MAPTSLLIISFIEFDTLIRIMNNVLEINTYSLYLNPYKTKSSIGLMIILLLVMQVESKHFFVYHLVSIGLQCDVMYLNIFERVLPVKNSNATMLPQYLPCSSILSVNPGTRLRLISWDSFQQHLSRKDSYSLLLIISPDAWKCLLYAILPRPTSLIS